jgi:hypothetical protein
MPNWLSNYNAATLSNFGEALPRTSLREYLKPPVVISESSAIAQLKKGMCIVLNQVGVLKHVLDKEFTVFSFPLLLPLGDIFQLQAQLHLWSQSLLHKPQGH